MDEALTDRQSVFHQFECICSFRSRISNRNGLRKRVTLLDRKDLENEYLNIYDEASQLKTLINIQQDKIKKLLTKLVRTANQQKRINSLQKSSISLNKNTTDDQTDKINELENSNQKLVSKINSLKLQLLTQKNISVYKKVSKKNQIRNGNRKSLTTRTMTQHDNDVLKENSESENHVQIDETLEKQAMYIITLEDKVVFLQNLIEKLNPKNNEKIKELQNELDRLQTVANKEKDDSDTTKYKQGCICEKYANVEMMNSLLKEQLEGALKSNSNLMDQLREERIRIVALETKLSSSVQVSVSRNNEEDEENLVKLREKEERMHKAAAQFQKEKEKMLKEIQDIKMTSEAINGVNSRLNSKISDMQVQLDILQIQSAANKSSETYPVEYDTNVFLDNIPQKETITVNETDKEIDCQIELLGYINETPDEGDLGVPEEPKVDENYVLIVNPSTPEETSIINYENGIIYSRGEDSPHEQSQISNPNPNKSIFEVSPRGKESKISEPTGTTKKDTKYRRRRPSYSYSSRSKLTNTYSDETSLTHNDFTEDTSSTSISLGEVDSDNGDAFNLDEFEINSTTDVIKKALTHIVQELRIYTNMFEFNDIKHFHSETGLANKQIISQQRKNSETPEENVKANNALGEMQTAGSDLKETKREIDDTSSVKLTATEKTEIKAQEEETVVRDDGKYAEGLLILHFAKLLLDLRKTTRLKEDSFVFLTWQFYDKSSKFTPIKSCRDASFDYSATYDLEFSPQLVQYLKNNTLSIELHHTVEDHSEILTRCMLPLGPVLESPNTLVPLELAMEGFGKLECDFIIRLRNKDIKELRTLYDQAPVQEITINDGFITL